MKLSSTTTQAFLWGVCLFCLVVTLGGPTTAQACCAPLPAGLVGWWPGDTDAQDVSGNGHHATLSNGAQAGVAPGKVAGAFQFDGVDDVADTSVLLPAQGTLELWLNPTALDATHGILGTFGLANGEDRLWLVATGPGGGPGVGPNRLVVNLGSCCTNDLDIPSPLVVGAWTHLALTFDYLADSYTLYVNGQAVASSTAVRAAPTQGLDFGGVSSTFGQAFFFPGVLDEVTLYDRVLTAAEIQAIVTADSAGKCTTGIGINPVITLTASGYKVKGLQKVDLAWSGATGALVDIVRNGVVVATPANNGAYTDNIDQKGGGSYTYQVCEAGSTTACSTDATVSF